MQSVCAVSLGLEVKPRRRTVADAEGADAPTPHRAQERAKRCSAQRGAPQAERATPLTKAPCNADMIILETADCVRLRSRTCPCTAAAAAAAAGAAAAAAATCRSARRAALSSTAALSFARNAMNTSPQRRHGRLTTASLRACALSHAPLRHRCRRRRCRRCHAQECAMRCFAQYGGPS
eukprot:TRINITY_DN11058_c0_g1_i1.p1 TRINITY_DN11058_c0_g1~~TRINITY_DN11058_c0_g1_i1.p1  ORF type:complete len:179 (-),score=31.37 TRINITY_DN11058_c0_g1_i1:367-903(-)